MTINVELNPKQLETFRLLTDYDNGVTEVLYGGGSRGGKCLGYGTLIRMADFSIKPVQDVVEGDLLLGDDGTPRKVLSTSRGREQMYWVRQKNGMDYRVNESHILSLRYQDKKCVHTQKNYKRTYKTISNGWNVVNISISDYLKKTQKFRNESKGYRAFEMHFEESVLPIDPYFFGLWLGDGTSVRPEVTLNDNDTELVEYCKGIADSFGLSFKWRDKSRSRGCKTYAFSTEKKNVNNPMLDVMREMGIINNKHIPIEYIKNSKENRLQLLAGLIDTDGYLHNGCYEICTKYDALAEGIISLCGSLGFVTRVRDKVAMGHTYRRIAIIGNNLHEIPCRLERKRCGLRKHFQNANHTGITVEKDIVDDYYGFTIDGNHLFCLADFTVTHNTWLGCFWQITRRLLLPESVGMICRNDYVELNSTTMVTFWEVVKSMGLSDMIKFKGGIDNYAYFPNGSKIFFRYCKYRSSDPNFDRFGSYEITDLYCDEAQQLHPKFISVIKGRFSKLRHRVKVGVDSEGKDIYKVLWEVKPKAMYGCNPHKGWIYADFWKPFKEKKLPPWRAFVRALVTDNPFVPQSYIDNLMKADKVTIQRLRYGNFDYDDDPNALFDDYDALCDLFHNEHIKPNGVKSGSGDIAGKGHDHFVAFSCDGNVFTLEVDEEYSEGRHVEQTLKSIMINRSIPRSMMIVDADGIGSFLESYLNGIKEFHGGSRPTDMRYANLKAQCYFKLADLVKRRAIRIVGLSPEQQEKLKEELQAIRIVNIDDDTGKFQINSKDEQKEILSRSPDLADALMMAMSFRLAKPTTGANVRVGSPV